MSNCTKAWAVKELHYLCYLEVLSNCILIKGAILREFSSMTHGVNS